MPFARGRGSSVRPMAAGAAPARPTTTRGSRASSRAERTIFGVPSRFMAPRLVFVFCVVSLTAFGLLMIYSSSSISSLTADDMGNNPAYYLQKQLVFMLVGIVIAALEMVPDYRSLVGRILPFLWVGTILMLAVVFLPFAGADAYGATRWVAIGPFTLQPSEFAKITVILCGANLMGEWFGGAAPDFRTIAKKAVLGIVLPMGMILLQPDKGTVMVLGLTLIVMLYFAGFPPVVCAGLVLVAMGGLIAISFIDSYSRARIFTMINPWADPDGAGYQLIQGFYAFGTGGLTGLGIGMSKQKYSYLPMAYNDFIFAVVGEELGLLGCLGLIAAFIGILWAGLRIARFAPDLAGQLVACGCTMILVIQMFLNVSGVLGLFPLSGKPIPFVSYGGSSIISSLMLAGLVLSVSLRSELPDTEHDELRRGFSVAGPAEEDSGVGEPTLRSSRPALAAPRSVGLTVHGGGRASGRSSGRAGSARPDSPAALRREREERERTHGARVTTDSNGRRRIDLGPSAGERLRRDSSPNVRGSSARSDRRSDRRGR